MLRYEFHPVAVRELDEAVDHYEALAPSKGLELARSVRAAIAQICAHPDSAPISRGTVRSIVVQPDTRWTFTVHYRAKQDHIRILAVAHHARQPFYWFGRR